VVEHLYDLEESLLNRKEREQLIEEILDQSLAWALELLLKDDSISDILINGPECLRGT